MSAAERYARVRALFEQVCDLAPDARDAQLAASGADADTLIQVRALLRREQATTRHSDRPVLGLLGAMACDECAPGDVLGAWTLLRRIGHGGMGSVYLAQRSDGHFEQVAAIKVLRGIPSPVALAHLARERQILARLAHPHIARLYDGGATASGHPYLVMEYIDGIAIDDYCHRHALRLPALLQLFTTVCTAVGFAHQRLIVHCDLKPGNILVDAAGRPMLLDFGVARLLDHEADGADTARAFTPGYASPEQRDGGIVTTATDVYSLGRLLTALFDALAARGGKVAAELRAVAARASAVDATQRYAGADALAQDLTRYLQGRPLLAMPPTRRYRFGKFLRRRWPWVATFALFAVTVAGFTLRVMADRDRAQSAERQALHERDRAVQAQASSQQIADFLVSVLNASHPDAGGGEIPTSRLVEQALQRIDDELDGQPATQAVLFATLAGVQQVLGNPEQSLRHFDRAIALQRELHDPLVLAGMLRQRALLARQSFSRDAAAADAGEALALIEPSVAKDSPRLADALALAGRTLSDAGQYTAAEPLLLRALALHDANDAGGRASLDVLDALGDYYRGRGDHAASLRYYECRAGLRRQFFGTDSSEAYEDLETIGMTYSQMHRFDEAEASLRRALDGFRGLDGDDSAELAWRYSQLARVVDDSGRPLQALPLYRQALAIGEKKIGATTVSYAVLLNNIARAQRRSGDFAAAERAYAQALPIMEKAWPPSEAVLNRVATEYGLVLLELGRYEAAHRRLETAWRNRVAAGGEQSAPLLQSQIALAEWETRSGQPAKALARLQAVAGQGASLDELDRAAYARGLGLAQAGLGQVQQALADFERAERLTRETLGENNPRSWLMRLDRAELLAVQPDRAARATAAQLAVQIRDALDGALVADSPLRARIARVAAVK